ncbi:hypothetical protein Cgig2_000636 [Carnegiea gigantea]|uniref:Photosystem I assembly protein Ycf3 n=1 Tax=Carnegiea gigantea TaxID=171969 RepID=A0A9Q1JMU8_9CARY|nr:hypothetical protein Cgig2_000636 [Carnegiea gigantea]
MPRSHINENFIDKTFTIVANILLRIIPTTSGENEAFTYYKNGDMWEEALHLAIDNTNVLQKLIYLFPFRIWTGTKKIVRTTNIHLARSLNDSNRCWLNLKEIIQNYYEAMQLEVNPYDQSYILYNIGLIHISNGQHTKALSTQSIQQEDSKIAEAWLNQAIEYSKCDNVTPENYIEAQNWLRITGHFE